MGVLGKESPPAVSAWASGILEFSKAAGDGMTQVPRRLILRHAMSNPDKGVLLEWYRPELVDVTHAHLWGTEAKFSLEAGLLLFRDLAPYDDGARVVNDDNAPAE